MTDPGTNLAAYTKRRRILIAINVVAMTVLMAGFLVVVNLIASARYARIDMTADKVWEISPQAKQIVRSVKHDLEIYLNPFVEGPAGQDRSLGEAWRRTERILLELRNLNSKIRIEQIREGTRGLAEVVNRFSTLSPNTIYFILKSGGDKPTSRAINIRDLYQGDPMTGELLDYRGEAKVVSTIAQLITDRRAKIYGTTGHREYIPTETGARGMSALANRLEALENAEFKPLDLVKEKAVPTDADILFIAAPVTDFSTIETDALRDYWRRGGRIFAAFSPLVPDRLPELKKFFEDCGVKVNRDYVFDAAGELGDPHQVLIRAFPDHPVNQGMYGQMFRIAATSSVDPAPKHPGQRIAVLWQTGPQTWAETDLRIDSPPEPSLGEKQGQIPVAVASEELRRGSPGQPAKPSRMIVWGGVSALTNYFNMGGDIPNEFTLGYIQNHFRWLLDREEVIAAPAAAKKPRMRPFTPPPGAISVIGWVSIGVIPLLGVVLGVLAWFFRRK